MGVLAYAEVGCAKHHASGMVDTNAELERLDAVSVAIH